MPPPVDSASRFQSSPLAVLRQLEWRVRHAVENVLSGEYRSAFRGRGMEFDQVVKYEYGDDIRDIDWNVTARLGEPYRKKFVEEREVTLLLVFEDSASLRFGSGDNSKREALLELAGFVMLPFLSAVNRDRGGLCPRLARSIASSVSRSAGAARSCMRRRPCFRNRRLPWMGETGRARLSRGGFWPGRRRSTASCYGWAIFRREAFRRAGRSFEGVIRPWGFGSTIPGSANCQPEGFSPPTPRLPAGS